MVVSNLSSESILDIVFDVASIVFVCKMRDIYDY